MEINSLYELNKSYLELINKKVNVTFNCWIRNNRSSGKIGFLNVTDGTANNIQVVYKKDLISNFDEISKFSVWSAIKVSGNIVLKDNDEKYEINATQIQLLAVSDSNYPLQNKEHSYEFLREISHLRARSNLFNAVMRIRSEAAYAAHNFFHNERFLYLNAPEITENDGEGAGENFIIKTRQKDEFFFGEEAYLTVSGQLHAEAYAQAFKNVYTFGPTFRAENSHTNRHISEFWMIEPEMAFKDQKYGMQIAEALIKYVIKWVLENCMYELKVCANKTDTSLIEKLQRYLDNKFPVIEYKEAINLLKKDQSENKVTFENKDIFDGLDLGSEHEKYICEKVFNLPTFIINYPKEIKAFYMKLNQDKKTVAAYDCLVPGIGEVVGGSERENNIDIILNRLKELKISPDKLNWYLELRKYGYYKSVGFGIGFERLIMMLTGIENIRDVIAFPRYPGSLKF